MIDNEIFVVNNGSPKAKEIAETIERYLDSSDFSFNPGDLFHTFGDRLIFVVGGDGFLLESIKKYGLGRVYAPINGGSLGFLLNDFNSNTMEKIVEQKGKLFHFPTLNAKFKQQEDIAINEICVERMSSQTTRLDVVIDGEPVVEGLAADGLIVSTSLGSTGYNFSAGGAICHPSLQVMSITPICSHYPKLPPFVVPITSEVWVRATEIEKRPVKVTVDGREYLNVPAVQITNNIWPLDMIYFEGHNFTYQLVHKILKR